MPTRDYLYIGLKLNGVYFGVLGVTVLSLTLINLAIQGIMPYFEQEGMLIVYEGTTYSLLGAMQPIAYLVCAFALTRKTDWCLSLIDCHPNEPKTARIVDRGGRQYDDGT